MSADRCRSEMQEVGSDIKHLRLGDKSDSAPSRRRHVYVTSMHSQTRRACTSGLHARNVDAPSRRVGARLPAWRAYENNILANAAPLDLQLCQLREPPTYGRFCAWRVVAQKRLVRCSVRRLILSRRPMWDC